MRFGDGIAVFEVVMYIRERWAMGLSNGKSEVESRAACSAANHCECLATDNLQRLLRWLIGDGSSKESGWFRHNGTLHPMAGQSLILWSASIVPKSLTKDVLDSLDILLPTIMRNRS